MPDRAPQPVDRQLPTDEARDLISLVRDIAQREIAPKAAEEEDAGRFPRDGRCRRRLLFLAFFLSATSLFLALAFTLFSLFPRALLGKPPSVFLSLLACLLFFNATAIFRFHALALTALRLDAFRLPLNSFFGLATLLVDLVLMLARPLFEHIPFDVRGLAADLDVDRASATLCACDLQIALRLTLERDLARSGVAVRLASVAAAQMREQLHLRIVADAVIRT